MELPTTVTLLHPVQHGQETIDALTFTRRPVAGDLRGVRLSELDNVDNIILLTSRLTGVPPSVAAKLDLADLIALGEVFTSFLPTGPRTGSLPAES